MNYGPLLFLGVFLTLASSWVGLVLVPQIQFGRLEPVKIEETGEIYPMARSGLAEQGRELYRAYGCVYCHSQQVRAEDFGADIQRGWGKRRSVARDYLRDKPVLLGTMRTGPDLTNIGMRQPSVSWHLLHLYDPQMTSAGSIMPPYAFLFDRQKQGLQKSPDALPLSGKFSPDPGYEIIPSPEARALVAYLLSLKSSASLPEVK
ncbi:MAG TPA: cbb3-type cytochrome c oxidase subunit II [Candidatus Paceibacterota bacterium]|nr:cbb3-type cytochrome c oxidase subunit II [Verrucomicrobiota bacterium]HRY49670.1 cbb3-type cytochrome c oxidase subunit II [Candidatus Paceibacterota bacterium]HSA00939.1 cbb3-type cytochrome c oxidase subunit II [Candidatus Paceibacterota bacterium]